jgi:hypothetical protein
MSCDDCPYMAVLDAADDVITEFEHIHQHPAVNRGTVEIDRRVAEAVRARVQCDGPTQHEGRVVCPLTNWFNTVVAMVDMRPNTGALDPEKVINGEPVRALGQFL